MIRSVFEPASPICNLSCIEQFFIDFAFLCQATAQALEVECTSHSFLTSSCFQEWCEACTVCRPAYPIKGLYIWSLLSKGQQRDRFSHHMTDTDVLLMCCICCRKAQAGEPLSRTTVDEISMAQQPVLEDQNSESRQSVSIQVSKIDDIPRNAEVLVDDTSPADGILQHTGNTQQTDSGAISVQKQSGKLASVKENPAHGGNTGITSKICLHQHVLVHLLCGGSTPPACMNLSVPFTFIRHSGGFVKPIYTYGFSIYYLEDCFVSHIWIEDSAKPSWWM